MPNEAIFIIDIETTGLDPVRDQVLQFGGILYDVAENRIVDTIEVKILHERISGNYFACNMNSKLILEMFEVAKKFFSKTPENTPGWWSNYDFNKNLKSWLKANGAVEGKDGYVTLTPCGKNAAAFDVPFINNLMFHPSGIKFRHRVLDVGSIMYDPKEDGATLPDLKACLIRAGWDGTVAHTAMADCEAVLHCLRYKYHGIRGPHGNEA